MPIFEYRCAACGHVFEKLTLSKAAPSQPEPDPDCARCGGRTERLLSAFSARSSGGAASGSPAAGGSGGGGCGRPGGCGCN